MVGEIEAAVFVVVVDLLVFVVLDLGVGVFFPFVGDVLQGQALFQPLAHLNYFIIISIPNSPIEDVGSSSAIRRLDIKV